MSNRCGLGMSVPGRGPIVTSGQSHDPNVAVSETTHDAFDPLVAAKQAVDIAAPMMHPCRVAVVELDQMRFAKCVQKGLDDGIHGRLLLPYFESDRETGDADWRRAVLTLFDAFRVPYRTFLFQVSNILTTVLLQVRKSIGSGSRKGRQCHRTRVQPVLVFRSRNEIVKRADSTEHQAAAPWPFSSRLWSSGGTSDESRRSRNRHRRMF